MNQLDPSRVPIHCPECNIFLRNSEPHLSGCSWRDAKKDAFTGIPLVIVEKLAQEAREREARTLSWELIADELRHLKRADIVLEQNPLDLGAQGMSYLEQVKIFFPEVGPGYGEAMHRALMTLFEDLLPHLTRDRLTDAERITIGWNTPALPAEQPAPTLAG